MNQVSAELVSLFYTACWTKRERSVSHLWSDEDTELRNYFSCQWSRARWFLGFPRPIQIPCVLELHLSVILWFSSIKPKQINTPARDSLSSTKGHHWLRDWGQPIVVWSKRHHCSPTSLCPWRASPAEAIQDHKQVFLECHQSPGDPASQSETGTEGGGEEGGRRASVTSVGSETSICSMGQLGDTIANSEQEEQDPIYLVEKLYRTNFRLPVFVCGFFFQSQEAGGAPRGWITLCTVLTFWPPSPPWLCLTFSTPPTGSPPMWQLLFSGRWAHWFFFLQPLLHLKTQKSILGFKYELLWITQKGAFKATHWWTRRSEEFLMGHLCKEKVRLNAEKGIVKLPAEISRISRERSQNHFVRKVTVSSSASLCRQRCGYSVNRSRAVS